MFMRRRQVCKVPVGRRRRAVVERFNEMDVFDIRLYERATRLDIVSPIIASA